MKSLTHPDETISPHSLAEQFFVLQMSFILHDNKFKFLPF